MEWAKVWQWFHDRERLYEISPGDPDISLKDRTGAFFLWMIFAIGYELDPNTVTSDVPTAYFGQAMLYSETVFQTLNLTTIRATLLLVYYAFRGNTGSSIYQLSRHAMSLVLELGLHRRSGTDDLDPYEAEQRKRVFWSAYAFDRIVSQFARRPFSVTDGDVDIELPLDIDSGVTDADSIRWAVHTAPSDLTDITFAIHNLKLYRIGSRLFGSFYCLDAAAPSKEAITTFLTELEEWKRHIPSAPDPGSNIPSYPRDALHMRYLHWVLFVLRPTVLSSNPDPATLYLCATAAVEACNVRLPASFADTT